MDEVITHERRTEQAVDLAVLERMLCGAPERFAEVRQYADVQQRAPGQHRAAAQVRPCELALCRRYLAVDVSRLDLMTEALEQFLGIVRIGDRAAPHSDHLVVRAQEYDVAFARVIIEQASIALEAIPQRRLRQRLQEVDR